ncbi:tryptophan--tRNA ligase [Paramaledivibacter caminithermalis]|jgi:tryptophanyl-tRNA synthetase|uniref:Tryptophan--tRNA ligase n=1 Tax=Paramaledivibacter caminithermalis (strain DSM 15212 / CIP 107654 / DViRD3) TaxID=1121301 RepID=A0A1M6NXI4_PARC5|nr:tryptophan--tRNA ligase [Paramaledivibacter caminithermalis]SHK00360.1 tryptophanyl-tRNA synthetase [Paramaledivibacter caminithermalis DSM 15212]
MKRVFSGVQPTSQIHIGNYIGAIKRFVELQNDMDCFFCIVDLHSITIPKNPKELYENSLQLAALYMAVGLDPTKVTLFLQSHVPAHSELAWLLQCNTYIGELNRMTQFKEKSQGKEIVTTGLYTYPVLMAADILLYDTNYVPVGNDQKQHLELCRDIAIRFNKKYGDTFVIPEPLIAKFGARIMSLDDAKKKMSKSNENKHSKINLLDSPSKIKKSIMKAVTDSESEVRYDEENKPGVSNLMTIYNILGGLSLEDIENKYKGMGYGAFKKDLVEVVVSALEPIQIRYEEILKSGEVEKVLKEGAERAQEVSNKVLDRVKRKMGFIMF